MNIKHTLASLVLAWTVLVSFSSAEVLFKYTPIVMDEIQVMIPYEKIVPLGYVPPADSVDHTTVTTIEGKKIRVDRIPGGLVFEGAQDKVVLFEIFGYSCPHCIASIPGLKNLRTKYADKDLLIIAVERYGLSNSELKQYVADHGINYIAVAKENEGKIETFASILTGGASNQGVPYMMVFSKQGELVDTHLGDLDEASTDALIQSLLAQ